MFDRIAPTVIRGKRMTGENIFDESESCVRYMGEEYISRYSIAEYEKALLKFSVSYDNTTATKVQTSKK